ncbi:MAG: septum site-determining protein MinC [Chloroflexota bacterium]
MKNAIDIKGIRDGLLVRIIDDPEIGLFDRLPRELETKRNFMAGSRIVVEVGRRRLTDEEVTDLQKLFEVNDLMLWAIISDDKATRDATRRVGLATRLAGSATDLEGNSIAVQSENGVVLPINALPLANALMLRETLRSGRSVWHEGHVIILGDVNPGAEVIAAGSVIVWGRLRGLVHAGALGDDGASICALDLNPMQLRIADQIAIAPADHRRRPEPEQAKIVDGQIVAELWRAKHGIS